MSKNEKARADCVLVTSRSNRRVEQSEIGQLWAIETDESGGNHESLARNPQRRAVPVTLHQIRRDKKNDEIKIRNLSGVRYKPLHGKSIE
jgi:hypothetical protein